MTLVLDEMLPLATDVEPDSQQHLSEPDTASTPASPPQRRTGVRFVDETPETAAQRRAEVTASTVINDDVQVLPRPYDAYVDIDGVAIEVPPPYKSYDDVSIPARAPPRYRFPRPKRYPVTRCVAIFIAGVGVMVAAAAALIYLLSASSAGNAQTGTSAPQYPDKPYLRPRRLYPLKGEEGSLSFLRGNDNGPAPRDPDRVFIGDKETEPVKGKIRQYRMVSNETGNTLVEELVYDGHGGMAVDATAVFPHRGILFTGGRDKVVNIWDVDAHNNVAPLRTLSGHTDAITTIEVDEQNGTVYSGSLDGTVRMYEASSGLLLHIFNHTDAIVKEYGISTINGTVVVGARDDAAKQGYPFASAAVGITAIMVVSEYGRLFTMNALNDVREWSIYTGKLLRRFGLLAEPELNPRGIAVDANYTRLYAGDARNTNTWPLLYGIYEYDISGDDGGNRSDALPTDAPFDPTSLLSRLQSSPFEPTSRSPLLGHFGPITKAVLHPLNHTRLFTASLGDPAVIEWDTARNEIARIYVSRESREFRGATATTTVPSSEGIADIFVSAEDPERMVTYDSLEGTLAEWYIGYEVTDLDRWCGWMPTSTGGVKLVSDDEKQKIDDI
ncbi:WD40-repeat-containing domain protein [Cladochytrium replicatum]|nr:WD40-repeat-containing domain protein [Cladochytrium replicatum]